MSAKPNLLVKNNLVRHLAAKIKKLQEIKNISVLNSEPLISESLLTTVVSHFEAALLDTVREYVYSKPDEIYELKLHKFDKKVSDKDKTKIKEMGLEEYLIESFLDEVAFADNKGKFKNLEELTGINVDLGNERWERIRETFARRNCLIHNDLIANNTYFFQAGQKAEEIQQGKKLIITAEYMSERIDDIKSLLAEVKTSLEIEYQDRTHVAAVEELWDYLFENHYPLIFKDCWNTTGKSITYKGPNLEVLKDSISPRTICLFTAWMSFFGYAYNGDLKFFSSIFYNNATDRENYSKKLKYLMDSFEKIDFQGFDVQVYNKSTKEMAK